MEGMNIGFFINIRKEVDCKDNRFKNEESYVNRSHLVSYSLLRIPRVFATPLTVSSGSERGAKPRGEETRGVE